MSIQHITYNMYIQKQHIQLRTFCIFRMCIRPHHVFFVRYMDMCSCYVNVHPK